MIKAVVDTCFLQKFKQGTELSSDFATIIDAAEMEVLIHPYVYENELSHISAYSKIVEHGICKKVEYNEFIKSEDFRKYYNGLFIEIYNDFYDVLCSLDSKKIDKMQRLNPTDDVFSIRRAKSSLGDVHIILMALFMDLPIILSEDSDLETIYNIAKKKINRQNYKIEMYRIIDLIDYIDNKDIKDLSDKDIKGFRKRYCQKHKRKT